MLHRCPAGWKLLLLALVLAATVRWPLWGLALVLPLYALARIPVRTLLAQVRPIWLLLVITGAFQVVTMGDRAAVRITAGVLASVLLAAVVTLTTRVSAMLDVIAVLVRPLRRVGIDPDRVALLLALTIRCVPMLADIITSVREAQLVRGAGRNPLALVVPMVVRTLRAADALGEALTARGVDD